MDDELEALREQTSHGDRLDEAANEQDRLELREAIREELDKFDEEGRQKTVSVWDGPMAALIGALEERPSDLSLIGVALQEELGYERDLDVDRSDVLRMALRLGFTTASPAAMKATREAVADRAQRDL